MRLLGIVLVQRLYF
ncbi:unnamed protein product [Ophioblennius macclurei]